MNNFNHHIENSNKNSEQDDSKPQGLTGLKNLGNTCFMNAAIQALSNCPPLTNHMIKKSLRSCRGELTLSYVRLMREMWAGDKPAVVIPNGILHGIKGVCSIFRDRRQQDAQEFLRYLLDQMHEELKEAVLSEDNHSSSEENEPEEKKELESNDDDYETCDSGLSSEISGFGDENPTNKDEDPTTAWIVNSMTKGGDGPNGPLIFKDGKVIKLLPKLTKILRKQEHKKKKICYRSIISDTFDGKIISSVECLTCGNLSTTKENFQDLSLPIPNKDHLLLLRVSGLQSIKDSESPNTESKTENPTRVSPQPSSSESTHLTTNSSQNSAQRVYFEPIQQSEPRKDKKYRNRNWRVVTLAPLSIGFHIITSAIASLPSVYHLIWSWLDYILNWLLGPPITLQDCLQAFFSLDELKGDDMYNCDKCKKLRNGVKLSRLLSLPQILCIHLKRFRHDLPYPQKITRHVSFPITGLDMSPYMSPTRRRKNNTNPFPNNCNPIDEVTITENFSSSDHSSLSHGQISHQSKTLLRDNECFYDLVAVICHTGTYASGHYITYALNECNQTWYEFDDQYVTPVDLQTIASCEAYVLFYQKSLLSPEELH